MLELRIMPGAGLLGVCAPPPQPRSMLPVVTLIVPVLDEKEAIPVFLSACDDVFSGADFQVRYLFVDDGSVDGTGKVLDLLARTRGDLEVIHLARNFGKEAALSAALDHVDSDAVVPIDVDLQDPPSVVVRFVEAWRTGSDVVLGRRCDRSSDSRVKRWSAHAFYAVINRISDTPLPRDVGDFRLMDRRVVAVMRQLPERNRFMKGLFAWVGFTPVTIDYVRAERSAGCSSWRPWRLWNFALDGITAFSSLPLRIWTYVGVLVAVGCLVFSGFIVLLQISGGIHVSGYASLIVAVLLVGSVQLISLGLLGEYLSRLLSEAKHRPLYVIDRTSDTEWSQ